MQFIDLAAQQRRIRPTIEARIQAILDHGQYILGPENSELEARLASYTGVSHALGCSSGTDALLMALMAYDTGPGDAVLTTPFTFIATAEAIRLAGATPVFVDIDPNTFNIDPGKLKTALEAIAQGRSSNHPLPSEAGAGKLIARGIIPVDLFGLPADYDAIDAVAAPGGLFVIEDAAQSFGAEYHGRKACSLARVGCTSFFPAKPLGCYGDGGAVFTDDDDLCEKMLSIRVHGQGADKYDNVRIGINGRLDAIQAAVLLAKLDIFSEEVRLRQRVAERYGEVLAGISGLSLPAVPEGCTSVWAQYSILAADEEHRAELLARLKTASIPTAIYYPKPLHLQTAFTGLGYHPGDFPVSEECARRIFSLPMHPYLERKDQERIADVLSA